MTKLQNQQILRRLLTAFPSAAQLFTVFFNSIISTILKRSLEEELRQYMYAIISAQTAGPLLKKELESFLDDHFNKAETNYPPASIPHSQASFDYMISVQEAAEFFIELCILVFARGRQSPFSFCAPPSVPFTKFRIRRALLRFQLYFELFHQPGDSFDSVSDWEMRFPEQELFWTRLLSWEIEECKCIYYLLVHCLNAGIANAKPISESNSLHYRGLPQLHSFICNTPLTKFGLSYISRFLAKGLYGFSIADPNDLNYFSMPRYEAFRNELSRRPRWEPSPCPGPCPMELTQFASEKEARTHLRLLGWCFWETETLSEWGVI
jgi:hypothetical protein